ncbi:hypothetical protein NC651_033963 [Populus alba x Populus x berolinensis]|nr:hypothetical protein NC651_033963 [Populus alba x Populus x berolinensis]
MEIRWGIQSMKSVVWSLNRRATLFFFVAESQGESIPKPNFQPNSNPQLLRLSELMSVRGYKN